MEACARARVRLSPQRSIDAGELGVADFAPRRLHRSRLNQPQEGDPMKTTALTSSSAAA